MQKNVWTFQYASDVKRVGSDRASYYVGWYDADGKRHAESCGSGTRGKRRAERRGRQIQSELDMGMHQPPGRNKWSRFREEYEANIMPNLAPTSRNQIKAALNHFERLVKPGRMDSIKTQTIDSFVTKRRKERGKKQGSKLSPATINKDLRFIKAALNIAVDWEFLSKMPKIKMVREPEKLVRYVTPNHFDLLYDVACGLARLPVIPDAQGGPTDWWQSLLATGYMTGWRIGELLAMRTEDVDIKAGVIITRHLDNKGKRDERVHVHPVVLEHLQRIMTDHSLVFRWPHDERALWTEFGRIQQEVGIRLTCREEHEHTPACHVYGFHDLRRAFATVNAKSMKPETLQKMMRHKSYKTTLGYVNLSEQIQEAASNVHVPDSLKKPQGETAKRKRKKPQKGKRRGKGRRRK